MADIKIDSIDIKVSEKRRGLNRRQFIKGGVAAGAAVGAGSVYLDKFAIAGSDVPNQLEYHGVGSEYDDYTAEDVIYSQCDQCNTQCTIKAIVTKGAENLSCTAIVKKIAGNPYSPLNMEPFGHIDYNTSPVQAAKGFGDVAVDGRGFRGGRTCLKGQAGIQTAFDATRLRKPLKRVGPRGSGQWQTISWEQAINEIVNGSSDLGTPALKKSWAYVEEEQVMADWDKVKSEEMSKEAFHAKYKDVLIDTNHPDFGPKSNQIVSMVGHRRDFIQDRFWAKTIGSINSIHHGGICGMSGVFGNIRSFAGADPKKRMYGDIDHSKFHIVWGTDPFVANKGPTWLAPKYINAIQRGMKMAVIDPRLSNAAEKADMWVVPKPGTDAALALGMARWIIENERYDHRYLINPNKETAKLDGEPTWSDASYLVNIDKPQKPKLRANEVGIGNEKDFVVLQNGKPMSHLEASEGELEVDTTINGIRVKSVFTLYKERVMEYTLAEYAKISGVKVEEIVELAREFTAYGKKASIISYRGPAMHANGFYAVRAINTLNHLIGNYDWKGGSISSGAKFNPWQGRYNIKAVPKGFKPWGISLVRVSKAYEKTTLFERDGYPAKRPWFPLSNHITHEVLPSAAAGYPYPIKAMFIHRISPILSIPAGFLQEEILKDEKAIPLLVVSDIVMGETATYADYVLPDVTYLERFGTESTYPNQPLKVMQFQQPVTRVYPEPRPTEDVYIEIAKKMGLPGVGVNSFTGGGSLDRAEDFYLKMIANIAYDGTPVPDASEEELEIFKKTRGKALGQFFNIDQWRRAVTPGEWKKVVYVLNRGGRFEAKGSGYEGEYIKYKFGAQAIFHDENTAKTKNSYDGSLFDGLPKMEEISFYSGQKVVDADYPLQLINWKASHIGTHRNISNTWLREINAENSLWMNPKDANARGIKDGDKVKVSSPNYEVEALVTVTSGIKPGVVGCSFNYGHFAYGSKSITIDGIKTSELTEYGHTDWASGENNSGYAKGRDTGFSFNNLQRVDESIGKACLSDWVGGGASQLDARVEVIKI
ncbi:MAG: molybdopterin oxidoreductase [Peptococcaceae bacterium BICA1-8]|nr:MAG: molybdopterin oxidoreductase [Peptococcaceae bacterium BICA1-8]